MHFSINWTMSSDTACIVLTYSLYLSKHQFFILKIGILFIYQNKEIMFIMCLIENNLIFFQLLNFQCLYLMKYSGGKVAS